MYKRAILILTFGPSFEGDVCKAGGAFVVLASDVLEAVANPLFQGCVHFACKSRNRGYQRLYVRAGLRFLLQDSNVENGH